MYEGQFLNVSFLAKQILGIPGSQTEIEHSFGLVEVLIALRLPLASGQHGPDHHYCEELA
jgi:hypothetical protein